MLKLNETYENFIIDFSKRYSTMEFLFTELNSFVCSLPEVIIILDYDINNKQLVSIEDDYNDGLEEAIKDSIDCRLYNGSCFVLGSQFNVNWYKSSYPYFSIKNGEFTKLYKVLL